MHFERLDVFNFGCYKGEHSIDLACSKERPVVVIIGDNGTGKSTLFDALNWALYGKDYEKDLYKKRERSIEDFINESAIHDAKEDKRTRMNATLFFEHEGRHYYITQSLEASVEVNGESGFDLNVIRRETNLCEIRGGNHKKIPYDSIFLDEVLPSNVRDYFLFDGDRIHNLSKPGSSKEIRDAIYRVVDLEIIKNAQDHLLQIAQEYRRKANKQTTGKLGEVEKKYNEAHDLLSEYREELDGLEQEKIIINDQLEQLTAKLQTLPDSKALQDRRDEAERTLGEYLEKSSDLSNQIRSSASIAGLGIARDIADDLINEINDRREKGLIPRTVSQTLLRDLLDMGQCICGTKFVEGDAIHKRLNNRLEEEEESGVSGQEFIDVLISLEKSIDSIEDSAKQLVTNVQERYKANQELKKLDLIKKQIDNELDQIPQEDVVKLTSEAKQRRQDLLTIGTRIGRISSDIEQVEESIKTLEKERVELSKKEEKVRALHLRESLAQKASAEIRDIYGTFADDSRKEVERLTKQEFYQFVKSGSNYDVEVNEEYELQVLDSHGNPALQRLSMGQSQCLSLSFITAISRVSEKYPPLVIDMPFGRLDNYVDNEVSSRIPEISSQVILFLLDNKEWYPTTEDNLRPAASHIYKLEFEEIKRETTIIRLQ